MTEFDPESNMSERLLNLQPDEWRIDMQDAWQVLWWCRFLGLTKGQLEEAVSHAGFVIRDVKDYLDRPEADRASRDASSVVGLAQEPLTVV